MGTVAVDTVMFALRVVVLMGLVTTGGPLDVSRYSWGQWIFPNEPQYDYSDGQFVTVEDTTVPNTQPDENRPTPSDQPMTTSELYTTEVQESGGGSSVWKPIVVTVGLLVAIVSLLSVGYYLCVERGGRIRYRPQTDVYT